MRIHSVSTGNNSICGLAKYYIFLIHNLKSICNPSLGYKPKKHGPLWFCFILCSFCAMQQVKCVNGQFYRINSPFPQPGDEWQLQRSKFWRKDKKDLTWSKWTDSHKENAGCSRVGHLSVATKWVMKIWLCLSVCMFKKVPYKKSLCTSACTAQAGEQNLHGNNSGSQHYIPLECYGFKTHLKMITA